MQQSGLLCIVDWQSEDFAPYVCSLSRNYDACGFSVHRPSACHIAQTFVAVCYFPEAMSSSPAKQARMSSTSCESSRKRSSTSGRARSCCTFLAPASWYATDGHKAASQCSSRSLQYRRMGEVAIPMSEGSHCSLPGQSTLKLKPSVVHEPFQHFRPNKNPLHLLSSRQLVRHRWAQGIVTML